MERNNNHVNNFYAFFFFPEKCQHVGDANLCS